MAASSCSRSRPQRRPERRRFGSSSIGTHGSGENIPVNTRSLKFKAPATKTNATAGSTRQAFKIVGWAGRPDLQQLIGSNGDGDDAAEAADQHDDMDDEVPFDPNWGCQRRVSHPASDMLARWNTFVNRTRPRYWRCATSCAPPATPRSRSTARPRRSTARTINARGWTAGKTCRRSPANRSKCGR